MVANLQDLPRHRYTLEEYFALEAVGTARYEYWNGDILCMSGGSPQHAQISFNLASVLGAHLDRNGCSGYLNEMAIKTPLYPPYRYPDASVACGEPVIEKVDRFDTLTNPTLIVEILSPATANLDKTLKRDAYQAIPSLREYLLIAQDVPQVTLYLSAGDQWEREDCGGLTATFYLQSLGCQLALRDIYKRVRFE
jgi:Uma2 family endonuclease